MTAKQHMESELTGIENKKFTLNQGIDYIPDEGTSINSKSKNYKARFIDCVVTKYEHIKTELNRKETELLEIMDYALNKDMYANTKVYGGREPEFVKVSATNKPFLRFQENFLDSNNDLRKKYVELNKSELACKPIKGTGVAIGELESITLTERGDYLRAEVIFFAGADSHSGMYEEYTILTRNKKTKNILLETAKNQIQQEYMDRTDEETKKIVRKYSPNTPKPKYVITNPITSNLI